MSRIDNLNSGELKDILRRLRILETATPMNNAAIGRSGLTVYDGGMITIENGGLRVTGTAEIIGELIASGSIIFNGPVRITGDLDIEGLTQIMGDLILAAGGKFTAGTIELNPDGSAKFGTLTIDPDGTLTSGEATINPDGSATFGQFDIAKNGDLDSKGTLDIKGKSTLQDDLEVKNGGKIKVGSNMTLTPAKGGGSIEFANGAGISSSGPDLNLDARDASLTLGTQAVLAGGSSAMVLSGSSAIFSTPLAMFSSRVQALGIRQAPAGVKANLYWQPSTGEIMYIP